MYWYFAPSTLLVDFFRSGVGAVWETAEERLTVLAVLAVVSVLALDRFLLSASIVLANDCLIVSRNVLKNCCSRDSEATMLSLICRKCFRALFLNGRAALSRDRAGSLIYVLDRHAVLALPVWENGIIDLRFCVRSKVVTAPRQVGSIRLLGLTGV